MSVKLYNLKKGDRFKLVEEARVPPDAPEGSMGAVYTFSHMDGMYAPVRDEHGYRYYFAAMTEVEVV